MHTNLRRGLLGTLFAGGLLALGTSVACAADTTSGSDGLASGTQVIAPVTAPVTLGATSIGTLGDSAATTEGSTAPAPADTGGNTTSGDDGTLSGTQVTAPVTAPVTLGATSIGILGGSAATTEGTTAPAPAPAPASTDGNTTSGEDGTLSGTQVTAPVTAPVTLGATSIGILGGSEASAGIPTEAGTDEAVTPPGLDAGGEAGGNTDGSGAAVGMQGTLPTAEFPSTGQAAHPAGVAARLEAPASGAGMLAMTGTTSGLHLVALALLCGGGLLLALRLVLQRRDG
jgi:hypothetical protein